MAKPEQGVGKVLNIILFLVFLSSRLLVCNLFFFSWPRDTLFSIPTAIVISFLFFSLFLLIMIIFVKKEGKIITKQRRMWRTVNSRNRKRKEKNESSVKSRQRRNSMERERIRRWLYDHQREKGKGKEKGKKKTKRRQQSHRPFYDDQGACCCGDALCLTKKSETRVSVSTEPTKRSTPRGARARARMPQERIPGPPRRRMNNEVCFFSSWN